MSKKEFTSREMGMIKNTAKTVYPMYAKLYKMTEQVKDLEQKIAEQQSLIDTWEAGVKNLTGGYTSMDLCTRELVKVGVDDKGRDINKATFKLTYGENVIPLEESIAPEDFDTPMSDDETVSFPIN